MPPETARAGRDPAPADHGLFGPASVTWRVMAEPVLWTAAFRALYLQALHPRVMRGTWQHTAFADPDHAWGRFLRTAEFVRVRTCGVPASPPADLATTAALRALRAGTSNGRGDRLILPATRAARDQARAFQRAEHAGRVPATSLPPGK
jgi:mpaB/rubber oxygenase-like protein